MHTTLAKLYRPNVVKWALNCWPPFWGSGIKIVTISNDFREARLQLKLRWWNKNANRSQYGGSIFSLTDPVYALMLMGILGDQYYVWDKQASINFIKPGHTDLYADFLISQQQLDDILAATACGDKCFPEFIIHVKNAHGEVVSEVHRQLYVRKKPKYRDVEPSEAMASQTTVRSENAALAESLSSAELITPAESLRPAELIAPAPSTSRITTQDERAERRYRQQR